MTSDKPPLPEQPKDLPRRGDSFKHWKGAVYVVTGVSRSEHDPREFNVHYLAEGVSDENEIPWRRTYDDFMGHTIPEPQKDWLHPVPVRRFEPVGRREIPSFLRPKVAAFARAMEEKLRRNDHKGGWEKERPHALLERIEDETSELNVVVTRAIEERDRLEREKGLGRSQSQLDAIKRTLGKLAAAALMESADVANFALMVADVIGGFDS